MVPIGNTVPPTWLYHPDLENLPKKGVVDRLTLGMRAASVDLRKAEIVTSWLEKNEERWDEWPWGVLISRLWEVYFGTGPMALAKGARKNVVNRVEVIFSERYGDPSLLENDAYIIPFTAPPPRENWHRSRIKFTLPAVYGMRSDCERAAVFVGGSADERHIPNIVVVGFLGDYERRGSSSIDWAAEFSEKKPIHLLSEEVWLRQAFSTGLTQIMSNPSNPTGSPF